VVGQGLSGGARRREVSAAGAKVLDAVVSSSRR
jgi:hypothetical protein